MEASEIRSLIISVRGQRVILDRDLARLYGVSTARLNQQVRRNRERFPSDFVFRLTKHELSNLMLQNATSSWGGFRKPPLVFTEHGALMAAGVLTSRVAIDASIWIVRTFIKLRSFALQNRELSRRLDQLESKYDQKFKVVFDAIRRLMEPAPAKGLFRIGFKP